MSHPEAESPKPSEEIYYPCHDPEKPVCRQFVNQGKCRKQKRCRFYHPAVITSSIQKKAKREPGHCFCGAYQRRLLNTRNYRVDEDGTSPTFFVVCGRTGRSMKRCM